MQPLRGYVSRRNGSYEALQRVVRGFATGRTRLHDVSYESPKGCGGGEVLA